MNSKTDLIRRLKNDTQVLKSESLESTFEKIDRKDFVGEGCKVEAYEDYPHPIGEGQTISQPTTVVFMLELLGVEEGDNVLDIGCGSGWTTALLAEIVGSEGSVVGLEIVPELVVIGRRNLEKYDFTWAEIRQAERGQAGLEEKAPYEKILVSAAFERDVPEELFNQLKVEGVLVTPVGDSVVKYVKAGENTIEEEKHHGFAFVPYIS